MQGHFEEMREGVGACIDCDIKEQRYGTRPGSHVPGGSGEVCCALSIRRCTGCRKRQGLCAAVQLAVSAVPLWIPKPPSLPPSCRLGGCCGSYLI